MIEVALLAYIPDPFAMRESRYMILESEGETRILSARELSAYTAQLMTYDVSALVDDLRRHEHPPPRRILDIGDAIRLNVARSKDDGGERLWNIWSALKPFFDATADGDAFELISVSRVGRPKPSEQDRLLREALKALQCLWNYLAPKLESAGELQRMISVEWPLQSVFAYRQFKGVRVDSAGAQDLLSRISSEKYAAYREVAEILNKNPTGLNFWNVHPYLKRTDVSHLHKIDPGGRLQDAFELAASHSHFASSFLSLVKAGRDETVVKRAMGKSKRLYPIFHVLGTISGRILVSDPYLQQLRRAYRSLIVPDPNSRLIYLDYAQFEPGVLAGLSEDKRLIAAYNAGDVYTALAEVLFGDPDTRPMAKRVFLAFSYGMTTRRIAKLLAGSSGSQTDQKAYGAKIDAFFKEFSGLEDYRTSQQQKLLEKGFVSSLFGNRRLRTGQGALTLKEKRWALNQPVQSTASLIFKKALLEISLEIGVEHIILPVHDAVVLQLSDDSNFDHNVGCATEIMIAAFSRYFPSVKARVTVGSFAE